MTTKEFDGWLALTKDSENNWREDIIYKLNRRGTLYHIGGVDGAYIKIQEGGYLSVGSYTGAYPHIGEALFTEFRGHQYQSYDEAFAAGLEAGGIKLLLDILLMDSVGVVQSTADQDTDSTGVALKL